MISKALEAAQDLAENGDLDKAYKIADKHLKDDPNAVPWLALMTYVMLSSHKPTIAYSLARRVVDLAPRDSGAWMNLGMAANDLWRDGEAERFYKKGLKWAKTDEQRSKLLVNLCAVLIDTGRFDEAEGVAEQALEYNPESPKSHANLGFCQLANRKWDVGWENYHYCLGSEWRPKTQYAGEPEWDGKGKGNIVLWAEQGLGDVISFASMVPDALDWASQNDSRIILDVDDRLQPLMQRTFPEAKVYGTRGAKVLDWDEEDQKIDYSLPLGQLGEFFRTTDESFGDGVFLKPDPDRVLQWRSLFKPKKKPVIGIAWRGGIPRTGSKFRQWDLEQLLPLLKSVDAHWVSLQYKPAAKEIAEFRKKHPKIDLVEYRHATLTNDYDNTVAMVEALDMVVCMQTAVVHVCGGLGKRCWAFVPRNSQWRYGQSGEDFVWADSVRIMRQENRGEWKKEISKAAEELPSTVRKIYGVRKAKNSRNSARQKRKRASNGRKRPPTGPVQLSG